MVKIEETVAIVNEDIHVEQAMKLDRAELVKPDEKKLENKTFSSENESNQSGKNNAKNEKPKAKIEDNALINLHKTIIYMTYFLARMFGMKLYTYQWNSWKSPLFWNTAICLALMWTLIFYNEYLHYTSGNYIKCLEPLALLGQTVSCTLKLYSYLKHGHRSNSLFHHVTKIVRAAIIGSRGGDILETALHRTIRYLKIFILGTVGCAIFFVSVPIYAFFVNGEYMTLMPLEVFFCDQSTLSGFVVANIVHGALGLLSGFACLLYGCIFVSGVSNYILVLDLLGNSFTELDGLWNGTNKISLSYKQAFLMNIVEKHQDSIDYLKHTKELTETKFFVYFAFNYLSQIICLFEVTQHDFTPGYAIEVLIFMEMTFYCLMGTKISIAHDKFCDAICNTKWYTYDVHSERTIVLILHAAQVQKEIQIGTIGPLNMVTLIETFAAKYFSMLLRIWLE